MWPHHLHPLRTERGRLYCLPPSHERTPSAGRQQHGRTRDTARKLALSAVKGWHAVCQDLHQVGGVRGQVALSGGGLAGDAGQRRPAGHKVGMAHLRRKVQQGKELGCTWGLAAPEICLNSTGCKRPRI